METLVLMSEANSERLIPSTLALLIVEDVLLSFFKASSCSLIYFVKVIYLALLESKPSILFLALSISLSISPTFSSRKLANKLKSDLAFMYLSGNNQADFRTINRFRKEK